MVEAVDNTTSNATACVPEGFKQTEVGVIPVDWEVRTLGDVGDVKMCKRIFSHQTQERGEIPFFKIGTFGKSPDAFIPKYLFNEYVSRFSYPSLGDILISASGTIGRTVIFDGKPAYFQDSNIIWIHNQEYLVSNELLYYVYQIIKYGTEGGTIQRLYNDIIKTTKFICPPKIEQTAIATALSDMDALITAQEQLIAKKRAIKQGAMQELLRPKEGWEVKTISSIGKPFGGLSGKSKKDFDGGTSPYIPFMNVMNNPVIDTSYFDYVQIRQGEQQNQAQKGDLFFNGSSETPEEVGMCSILLEDVPSLYLNSFCFGFRFHKNVHEDGLFLAYYFRSNYGRENMYHLAQGATRYNLSKTRFLNLELKLPELTEQTRIANILSDMDTEITQLETQLDKYRQVKAGMMQELLTGKKRLV